MEDVETDEATFFPIEITGASSPPAVPHSLPAKTIQLTAQRVDIALSAGRRILVEGPTALPAVLAMVEALAQ